VNAFTDAEEAAAGLTDMVPFDGHGLKLRRMQPG
jgi:hypothetical protein